MSGSLNFTLPEDIEDALTEAGETIRDSVTDVTGPIEIPQPAEVADTAAAIDVTDLIDEISRLPAPDAILDFVSNLDDLNFARLEGLIDRLPPEYRGPDSTGEVRTGLSDFLQIQVEVGAALSATARVVHTLGPDAIAMQVRGYDFAVNKQYNDNDSGFSAIQVLPADGGPMIFVIDGLEVGSIADTVAAVDLGGIQVRSAAFQEMIADAVQAQLALGRGIQFVGPSLGGAVAQVAAHEAAEALLATGQPVAPGAVKLITVDALGGRDAAEALNGGSLDAGALSVINALNIRTQGDLISRIGSHIGESLSFQAVDANGNPIAVTAADAHVNVTSLLRTLPDATLYNAGVRGAPEEVSGFALVANALGRPIADGYLASGERDDPNALVPLQVPGTAELVNNNTLYRLDADSDGTLDIAVLTSQPVPQAVADLVL
ncbi:hypothetical protein [Falsiroseomonas ponticola]|uniref:hypothetical protein n=1 Tax=Falsiroseomonas ponticola TaxID=2786951 RepID=UPI001931E7CE|nr:hypothetical protein [Roseomonas ponticola]